MTQPAKHSMPSRKLTHNALDEIFLGSFLPEKKMQQIGFARIIDRASTELLRMEEQNHVPAGLKVHPDVFDLMAEIRKRELAEGFPLFLLGLPVAPDSSLNPDDYQLVH